MFICSKCDAQFPKWSGRCDVCDSWGTVSEQIETKTVSGARAVARKSTRLLDVASKSGIARIQTKNPELDRVLGGGIVPGSLILLAGEPGIGKSTLVAQIAGDIADEKNEVLYVSGEESPSQLAGRFERLGRPATHIRVIEPVPVETVVATAETEKPALVIVDSVQTLTSSTLDSTAGSPTLVRFATSALLELAKRTGVTILLVGQVTKDGTVAGPKTLEHLVDTVLALEGDSARIYRMLRSTKNRFGGTDELGVFEMTSGGLQAVENPSERFLEERAKTAGSVITATVEGSRVFLVEVQALVEKTSYGTPVRRASGFDQNRLQMLCAIMNKRAGLKLGEQDVYVNVIGGIKLKEPAADVAVCAALASAAKNVMAKEDAVYLGEVGLGGEVRSVPLLEKRKNEVTRLGLGEVILPKNVSDLLK